jgi:hypothetical protein
VEDLLAGQTNEEIPVVLTTNEEETEVVNDNSFLNKFRGKNILWFLGGIIVILAIIFGWLIIRQLKRGKDDSDFISSDNRLSPTPLIKGGSGGSGLLKPIRPKFMPAKFPFKRPTQKPASPHVLDLKNRNRQ